MPNSRRHLHVIFADRPEESILVDRTWLRDLSADEAFDKGCQSGALFDRALHAMWVIDRTGAPEVRRVYGQPPAEIRMLYDTFLKQAE